MRFSNILTILICILFSKANVSLAYKMIIIHGPTQFNESEQSYMIQTTLPTATTPSTKEMLTFEKRLINNNRNPSTDQFTPPPISPVYSLKIERSITLTYGTTKTITTTRYPTMMWVTITAGGLPAVLQTTYVQRYSTQYSEIQKPSVGTIPPLELKTITTNDPAFDSKSNNGGIISTNSFRLIIGFFIIFFISLL